MRENELLWCTCCGQGLRNNAQENVDYGKIPYPYDDEFGLCVECGGDNRIGTADTVDQLTEEQFEKRMGWQAMMVARARFPKIRERLSSGNQEKWDGMPLWKRTAMVFKLMEEGKLI